MADRPGSLLRWVAQTNRWGGKPKVARIEPLELFVEPRDDLTTNESIAGAHTFEAEYPSSATIGGSGRTMPRKAPHVRLSSAPPHPATNSLGADSVASRNPAAPIVEAVGFTYRYPPLEPSGEPVTALRDLTFTLTEGEIVGLVGASGSGLTTFCLALAGIVPHETGGLVRGQLRVAGLDTTLVPPEALAPSVGLVFEDPEANLIGLTVADEVALALELRGFSGEELAQRLNWALAQVGLAQERDRSAAHLSGGQKQRLALAVALACQPELLVLDVPTAQLDPAGKQEILQTIVALAQTGISRDLPSSSTEESSSHSGDPTTTPVRRLTILLAERDTDLLLPVANRILGLSQGELLLDTSPELAFADLVTLERLGVAEPQLAELARLLSASGSPTVPFRDLGEAARFLQEQRTGQVDPTQPGEGELANLGTQSRRTARREPATQHHRQTGKDPIERPQPSLEEHPNSPNGEPSSETSAQPLVVFQHVSYRYPDGRAALLDVSFTLSAGEVLAIVGANGAGKTTLARHITGALRPTAGQVRVLGRDTRTVTIGQLAAWVGYVAQNPDQQLTRKTVTDELLFSLRPQQVSNRAPDELSSQPDHSAEEVERRIEALLTRFGLLGHRSHHPALLSRGARQLLALAAAAIRQPKVLVLDEPTSALDQSGRERLAALLAERRAAGFSTVLISHDLRFVAHIADRVLLLCDGHILAEGTPTTILGNITLLAAARLVPLPVTQLSSQLGLPPVLEPADLVRQLVAEKGQHRAGEGEPFHEQAARAVRREGEGAPAPAPPTREKTVSPHTPAPWQSQRVSQESTREPAPSAGWLTRLDPRVKLFLALGGGLPVLLWQSPLPLLLTTLLLHLLLWWGGGFSRARLLTVWRTLAPLLILILLLRPLFDHSGTTPILGQLGPLVLTVPAVLAALAAALRVLALALLALAWIATTSERALVASLIRLGLPTSLGLAVTIGLRFIPLFAQTVEVTAEALQTRGLIIPPRGLARLRALLPVLSAALVATLRQAQQLGWVLSVRGVGSSRWQHPLAPSSPARQQRPRFALLTLQRRDLIIGSIVGILEIALILWTLAGFGRSPLWPWT